MKLTPLGMLRKFTTNHTNGTNMRNEENHRGHREHKEFEKTRIKRILTDYTDLYARGYCTRFTQITRRDDKRAA